MKRFRKLKIESAGIPLSQITCRFPRAEGSLTVAIDFHRNPWSKVFTNILLPILEMFFCMRFFTTVCFALAWMLAFQQLPAFAVIPVAPDEISKFAQQNYSNYFPNPKSRCSEFARDLASKVFHVSTFDNKQANAIFDLLRAKNSPSLPDWKALYDESKSVSDIKTAFAQAQTDANTGYLVIVASYERAATDPHGHVAIVVPGDTTYSGDWKVDVPQIAQAGRQTSQKELTDTTKPRPLNFYTFPKKPLSLGFSNSSKGPDFIIYVRK